jgi:hypothetical protein
VKPEKKEHIKPKKPARAHTPEREREPDDELDWTSLFGSFRDAFEWALNVAAALARDYADEVAAVERVRAFLRGRIAGELTHIRVEDILFTLGLLIAAIERDLGPIGVGRAAWYEPELSLRFPSADDWEPRIPRRFHGWSVDAHPLHLAAA